MSALPRTPPPRNLDIYRLVILRQQQQQAIARALGVTPSRVSQVICKVRSWATTPSANGSSRAATTSASMSPWKSNKSASSKATTIPMRFASPVPVSPTPASSHRPHQAPHLPLTKPLTTKLTLAPQLSTPLPQLWPRRSPQLRLPKPFPPIPTCSTSATTSPVC